MNARTKAAILRGAKFLDENHPGWAKKIKLKKLDMKRAADCVLGQLFRHGPIDVSSFYPTPECESVKVVGKSLDYSKYVKWLQSHGMDRNEKQGDKWDEMQELWIDLIRERRKKKKK